MNQHAASSASPAIQAAKRRHTAVFASEGNASPMKSVKRSKTLKTYGGGRRQIEAEEDGNFDQFRSDDGAPATGSQNARFSEHSGQHSSMPLPAGSIQTDFLNHEPAVMFRDTGDTVAEASSEQQRLLDQALASNKGVNTSLTKEIPHDAEQQSSSIPWTGSDIANSAKSKKTGTTEDEDTVGCADEANSHDKSSARKEAPDAGEEPGNQHEHAHIEVSRRHKSAKQDETITYRPNASPIVEIPLQRSRRAPDSDGEAEVKGRAARESKRIAKEEDSEALNSDDKAIGLPKERYQPRPSRRRATQVIEEPIDYSVIPEKAAKVKRTKTVGARSTVELSRELDDKSQSSKPGVSPPGLSKDGLSGDARRAEVPPDGERKSATDVREEDESPLKPRRRSVKQTNAEEQPEKGLPDEEQAATPDEPKDEAQAQADEDKIFVKPAIPTPKPKTASKARRSHTTIFEDHVEFVGSRRSPNLSQQQAKRKSALQDVKNEAAPPSQRKRKNIAAEDSDDEDELAKENDAVLHKESAPTKKRRGRPPKSDKQAQPKATESVSKDSDAEGNEHLAEQAAEQSEADEPPKKRGRGTPAKPVPKTKPVDEEENADQEKDNESTADPGEPPQKGDEAPPQSTPSKPCAPGGTMPTPSPEQPAAKTHATPQKPSAPVQHSPIKSSSKVPFRVGLSKKSRIPSLLKMNRPPKR